MWEIIEEVLEELGMGFNGGGQPYHFKSEIIGALKAVLEKYEIKEKHMELTNIDDMLEAGDDNRQELTGVHGLIAFFLTNVFEDTLDLEAECLDIIIKRFQKVPNKIKKEFYDYIEREGYMGICDSCDNCDRSLLKEKDWVYCECRGVYYCEDCCSRGDGCEDCLEEKQRDEQERCTKCGNNTPIEPSQTCWKNNNKEDILIQRIKETNGTLNNIRNLIFEIHTGEELQDMYNLFDITLDQYIIHLSKRAKESIL